MSPIPKKVLNDIPRAVDDALMGLAMSNNGLVLLDDQRIVLRRDHIAMNGKVKLIGGGGGGHEPCPGSYVGPGMLTSAVIGDIFTSPPANVILKAIRELGMGYDAGVLMVVSNFMGNCLNFGLALERARSEGIYVKMLTVGEDSARKTSSKVMGRRGLAGIVLVIKIAGAMAEEGRSLDDIFTTCQSSLSELTTVGFSLQTTYFPGTEAKRWLSSEEITFGVGVNASLGTYVTPMCSAKEIAEHVLTYLKEYCAGSVMERTGEMVVLVNNLGGSSKLEEHIFAKEILGQLSADGFRVARFYCGTFVTSLDTSGFSVSIMKLASVDMLPYLDAPTSAPAWPKVLTAHCVGIKEAELSATQVGRVPLTRDVEVVLASEKIGPALSESTSKIVLKIISFAAEALIAVEQMLNYFDEDGGGGGFGTNLKRGAMAIISAISTDVLCICRPYKLLQLLSTLVENSMGGSSGALYGIFFASAASVLSDMPEEAVMGPVEWINCFQKGIEGIQKYGQCKAGNGTMLDPMIAAITVLLEDVNKEGTDPKQLMEKATRAAEMAASNTVGMMISHTKTRFREPDPGAHCVGVWMRAICEAIKVVMINDL